MEHMAADVVVIGTGPGGMAAVAAAVAADAEVVVIEAMDHIDGNAVWSTAHLTFVDSEMQRRAADRGRRGDFRRRRPIDRGAGAGQVRRRVGRGAVATVCPGERRDLSAPGGTRSAVLAPHPETETALDRPDGSGRRLRDARPRVRAGLRLPVGQDPPPVGIYPVSRGRHGELVVPHKQPILARWRGDRVGQCSPHDTLRYRAAFRANNFRSQHRSGEALVPNTAVAFTLTR
jgi:hypothetical protein